MNGPTTWQVDELFTRNGIEFRLHSVTDTFGIATRVGAPRDRHLEVVNPDDIIKVGRG